MTQPGYVHVRPSVVCPVWVTPIDGAVDVALDQDLVVSYPTDGVDIDLYVGLSPDALLNVSTSTVIDGMATFPNVEFDPGTVYYVEAIAQGTSLSGCDPISFTTIAESITVTWNPADKSADEFNDDLELVRSMTLSGANLIATGYIQDESSGTIPWVRATLARSTGNYYFEIPFDPSGAAYDAFSVGLTAGVTVPPALDPPDAASAISDDFGTPAACTLRCAAKLALGQVWFAKDNDPWLGGGDPELGTLPFIDNGGPFSGEVFPFVFGGSNATLVFTGGFTVDNFGFAMPNTFIAWDGTS